MVGFSIKKKEDKPKGFSGFKLGKSNKNDPKKAKNSIGFVKDEDEEIKTTKIDTFDQNDGGFNKEEGPKAKEVLIIKNEGNGNWKSKSKERFGPNASKGKIEPETKKLQYGINYTGTKQPKEPTDQEEIEHIAYKKDLETRGEDATEEDYEKIPVDNFGEAMLRGMGWKSDEEEETKESKLKPVIPVAQRTLYLGLGAKDVKDAQNPRDGPIDKSYVPVRMISKKRERSPIRTRDEDSYRSR